MSLSELNVYVPASSSSSDTVSTLMFYYYTQGVL